MCWHVLCLCVGRWWCVLIVVGASVVSGQPKDMTIVQLPTSTVHTSYQHSVISYYLYTYTFTIQCYSLIRGKAAL